MKLSVFGLGKLGTPLAALLAAKGHQVIGVDVSQEVADELSAGRTRVQEPGLAELIVQAGERLTATTDGVAAALHSDVSFLIVPTPSEDDGNFALDYIVDAARQVGKAIRDKETRHTVVITSTVVPGATEGEIVPVIESESGRKYGDGFGVCYSPEFVALGNVVQDMLNPDIVLIGESETASGNCLEEIYRSVNENAPAIERMNIVNAEVTKLAVNTYVTTKISFANMLSDICENLPGGDAYRVAEAIGNDTRIGKKYIRPGVAYGGPCFPRDNKALSFLAEKIGVKAMIAKATDEINRHQNDRLKKLVSAKVAAGGKVTVLGLSYKSGTEIIEEAAGVMLASDLHHQGLAVSVFDPKALDSAKSSLPDGIEFAESIDGSLSEAETVVVTTPWPEFQCLPERLAMQSGRNVTVIDGWNMFRADDFTDNVEYRVLGRAP